MRHGVRGRKLGRTSAHRKAMFRNMLVSLMEHGRITTTLPKAKELRPIAERLVTLGKRDTVHARRMVRRWLPPQVKADRTHRFGQPKPEDLKKTTLQRIFDDIAPRFADRPGGYLRIAKLGPRKGDAAEMAILEFVDYELNEGVPDAD